ncbi:MAG: DNRLRE domain-containing protein, partial [Planctomycetaceae bacterium]
MPLHRTKFLYALIALIGVALSLSRSDLTTDQSRTHAQSEDSVRFAVIGDFGTGGEEAEAVANLVKSWSPDFIITTGDNNYPEGSAETIDEHIGQFYHEYIYPYAGDYGDGADENRFFPVLGNHDYDTDNAQPYFDYFTLPGNERYYDFTWGPVHFFALNTNDDEPDGNTQDSVQAQWLETQLAGSDSHWNIVYLTDPVYSSGAKHGSDRDVQWPFAAWGATAAFSGDDHFYERIMDGSFPYFVNGAGGARLYAFDDPVKGSALRYNRTNGAMLVEATSDTITFEFYSILNGGTLIDAYTLNEQTVTEIQAMVQQRAAQLVFTPEADTYVEQTEPTDNYGSSDELRADGNDTAGMESYLRFNVTGLNGPIKDATLRLYS